MLQQEFKGSKANGSMGLSVMRISKIILMSIPIAQVIKDLMAEGTQQGGTESFGVTISLWKIRG